MSTAAANATVTALRALHDQLEARSAKLSDTAQRRALLKTIADAHALLLANLDDLPAARTEALAADGEWRGFLRAVLEPWPGQIDEDPDAFRAHPEVRFSANELPIAPAFGIAVNSFAQDLAGTGASTEQLHAFTRSWSGGLASTDGSGLMWPLRNDGAPLELVAQLDLPNDYDDVAALPDVCLLQVFHDLESLGDLVDRGMDAWHVRLLEPTDEDDDGFEEFGLLEAPDGFVPATPLALTVELIHTVPAEPAAPLTDVDDLERYDRVFEVVEQASKVRMCAFNGDEDGDGVPPTPRVLGYSGYETNHDYLDIISEALPLHAPEDRHVLLVEITPDAISRDDEWFGGRPLQVWIRASDLAERRFTEVWAIVRTDC